MQHFNRSGDASCKVLVDFLFQVYAGKLAESPADAEPEGLRKRLNGKEEAPAAKAEAHGEGERCPISGKQGSSDAQLP